MRQALKTRKKESFKTMHDGDYARIFNALEEARAEIKPGGIYKSFYCPICGSPAFIFRREHNSGKDLVARCEQNNCFDCWE